MAPIYVSRKLISAGDDVVRLRTSEGGISVSSLVALWLDRSAPPAALERVVSIETLANAWRLPLKKRLIQASQS